MLASMRRHWLLFAAPTLLVIGMIVLPLALGNRTLYLRDVMNAHLPLKVAQAEAFRQGELPLIDLARSGGQPSLGNPNSLPLYPDNLLLLVADPLWVVNAHIWLHWLLAPFAFFWLARAFGLSRPASWAAASLYATSGYLLSLLNLYNLITVAALTPAFVAAGLDASAPASAPGAVKRPWRWPLLALLFGLLLLGGDPFSALLALALLGLALIVRSLRAGRAGQAGQADWRALLRSHLPLPAALGLGFLLTLPMWVEMLRILPASFRASIQAVKSASLTQSLHPLLLIEGAFPLFFGRFDYSFWGGKLYDQGEPLIVSIFPGLLLLALLPLALRSDNKPALRFGLIAAALGLFCALGRFNPLMVLLYQLPGVGALRFPVKFLLLAAIGLPLMGGLACERLLATESWRRLRPWLLLAFALYATGFLLVIAAPAKVDALLLSFDARLPPFLLDLQRGRLGATALVLALAALGMWLCTWLAKRSSKVALALILFLQVTLQVSLLECLYESDDADLYRALPAMAAQLPADGRIVHASFTGESFGRVKMDPRALPSFAQFWQARCYHQTLGPPTGIYFGREYELNFSPEGLDSYFAVFLGKWLEKRTDLERVRALAASGVDFLILPRELEGVTAEEAALLFTFESDCKEQIKVYRLERALPPLSLVSGIRRAGNANEAALMLIDPSFDPRREAVLPALPTAAGAEAKTAGPRTTGPNGEIEDLREERESLEATVYSADGGALATRRAYLPIYRAEIDGQEAATAVLNGHRLAVEVPSGRHRVRLYVDRGPTRITLVVATLAFLVLVFWAMWPWLLAALRKSRSN